MAEKVGVYVCHCGSNIAGKVDVQEVAKWAGEHIDGVVVARDYKFMCSDLGQKMIEDDIKSEGLTRVVVAACSPHLHEKTFRRACTNGGLNPYLLEMTNIREHCSWVHKDPVQATEKAKSLVSAAAERVKYQEPLEPTYVDVNPTTLVVGGGIAGLQATLELADAGYPVHLVERQPSIGGHMAQFDKTFPTLDCSACILTPKMSEAGQHEYVTLHAYSELEEVSGSVGNFKVKIRQKARKVDFDLCTGCGICVEKCPRKVLDTEFEAGMGMRKAIYMPFPQAVPRVPVLDTESCIWFERQRCGACQKLCPTNAIDYEQEDELIELNVGNIIIATGWKPFDCRKIPQYGYGRLANVYTSLEFERLCNAAGPTKWQDLTARWQDRPQVGRDHSLRREPGSKPQSSLLGRLLHGLAQVCPPGDGKDGSRSPLLLHRHPDEPEGLRRVLSAVARGRRAFRAGQSVGSHRCRAAPRPNVAS